MKRLVEALKRPFLYTGSTTGHLPPKSRRKYFPTVIRLPRGSSFSVSPFTSVEDGDLVSNGSVDSGRDVPVPPSDMRFVKTKVIKYPGSANNILYYCL